VIKAFLLSKHLTENANARLLQLLDKPAAEVKMLFCANAADCLPDYGDKGVDLQFVQQSRAELTNFGYHFADLNLRDYIASETDGEDVRSPQANQPQLTQQLIDLLSQQDIVFFTGGFYYNLLDQFYKTGLVNHYKQLLQDGLIHVGFSAGAMIFADEMKYYSEISSDDYRGERPQKGLGLFPHYIVPHYYDKPKYTKKYEQSIKQYSDENINFIPLTNQQGILLREEKWEII
jgi:hypothetical protein